MDKITCTTCYMCACRCGIKVHLRDNAIRYIEGNKDHPVNKGVLCAKGSAGIMQHYSPARLKYPMRRVGERGSGEFEEISWDEAMDTMVSWLAPIRATDPKKLGFFTGRDQSQSLTGFWASQFGTPNYAAHGGFCSVNMAAAGMYSFSGSFWEFGEPDWEKSKYFMLFGVAEDHDSNPIKTGITTLKQHGGKFISINPVRTGYSAIADQWLGIKPGTDGVFIMAIARLLLLSGHIDIDFLQYYTNAPHLIYDMPNTAYDGLIARDKDGNPLVYDMATGTIKICDSGNVKPALKYSRQDNHDFSMIDYDGDAPMVLTTAFVKITERLMEDCYDTEHAAEVCGLSADIITNIANEIADIAFSQTIEIDVPWQDHLGRQFDKMVGRPVSFHAMRGISAHYNGFQTCRALHLLQMLIGAIDCPGGFRYKAPYPKTVPPAPKPAGKPEHITAGQPLTGMPLGFPTAPEDLIVDEHGNPNRIDKAFSWEAPLAVHGMLHTVIRNAYNRDPYSLDVLMMYMANMAWNSSMNTSETIDMLTAKDNKTGEYIIPKIIYSDAFYSETVAYADLIIPDTTYLERFDCISTLDRPIGSPEALCDSIRQPVIQPDRNVRAFQDVIIELAAKLQLPAFTNDDGTAKFKNYADYIVNHQRGHHVGPLVGWRGEDGKSVGIGAPNPDQLKSYQNNGCFFEHHFAPEELYFKYTNRAYLEKAKKLGLRGDTSPVIMQPYSEILQKFRLTACLAEQGLGNISVPKKDRKRIIEFCDPIPFWYTLFEDKKYIEFPITALTQRPMTMYHSWGSQNAWLRQIIGANKIYLHPDLAQEYNMKQDDWIMIESYHQKIRAQVHISHVSERNTIWTWNAIGKRRGAWALDANADEANLGFLLNHLIHDMLPDESYSNSDPITGQAAWFDTRVKISKCTADTQETLPLLPIMKDVEKHAVGYHHQDLAYGKQWKQKKMSDYKERIIS